MSTFKVKSFSFKVPPRENCPYLELFWFAFSRIRTEYVEIRHISLYSVQMQENVDQNNSKHFLRSVLLRSAILGKVSIIQSRLLLNPPTNERFYGISGFC